MHFPVTRRVPQVPLPDRWNSVTASESIERLLSTIENTWSLSPETARVLAAMVVEGCRSNVLEFGAGVSSQILAQAVAESGGGTLDSLEENPTWCGDAWREVERIGTVTARLITAKIGLTVDRRGVYFRYTEPAHLSPKVQYDLVLIDAPWGRYGRDGALHLALPHLAVGGLIVLDDAARIREQRTLRRWLNRYAGLELIANDWSIGRGVAVLLKTRDDREESPGAFLVAEIWVSGVYELLRYGRGIIRHNARLKARTPSSMTQAG
ncbi:MAG: class I SAM-dependent methyltransferase [Longimicrobiales bacterium]